MTMSGTDIGSIMTGIATIITAVVRIKIIKKPPPTAPKKMDKRPPKKLWFFSILPIILGVFAISLAVVPRIIPPSPPSIKITSPEDKANVPQEIMVEGYTTKELPENRYLYIAVQWAGRWWLQYSNVTPVYSQMNKRWEFCTPATIGKEDDVGKTFIIVAVLVDAAIRKRFQSWFQQSEEAERWIGIPITQLSDWGEKKIYDSISVIRE